MRIEAWTCRPIDVEAWPLEVCERILSSDELDRANRFIRQADAERFRASHAALRLWLGERLEMPPADLKFAVTGPADKPMLDALPWRFSLSHTDSHWAAAVGECAVGIDIECLDRFAGRKDGLARMILSTAEREAWSQLKEPCATHVLAQFWTRKEALLKAIGTGLHRSMASVSVGCEPGPVTLRASDAEGRPGWWTLNDLPGLPSGLAGALTRQRGGLHPPATKCADALIREACTP
ncbi:4'-phosphopantetheinyl transferase superfamily protein [Variovorax sp. ZS18.2.2]|uniref:4'-phosphopantetheinyl transferase family protein n=1 Tax=Variovorax sp. ZS18.2.2 TaxID=2971255 RepID=UPI0021506DFA|nr:4'-phosphopantetheinyl transferase superfamily protein [Variovorax sp. ZS18.2.2]MCR6480863.1 4'-phosphopantetheinyl transferase superfamily protein [Variovorax sp. ZS18.2.2]